MRRFPLPLWLFACALAFITTAPYIVGLLATPEGWLYHGALPIPGGFVVDYNSHMAKMWQGSRGDWAYQLLFTSEPHSGLWGVQGFYLALGALSSLLSLSFPLAYHLSRIVLIVALVLSLWRLAARFYATPSGRWLVVLFGTISAGWSWLLLIFPAATAAVSPIEFWLFDAFTPLAALYMPHFLAAIVLQILIILALDDWFSQRGTWQTLLVLAAALIADAVIQPYAAPLFVMLIVSLAAYHRFVTKTLAWRRALKLALPVIGYSCVVLAQYLAMRASPVWAAFISQNVTASPDILFYLFGYAPFIIPIALGARHFLLGRKQSDIWWLPLLWLAIVAALLYAPLSTQRRYLLGVQTPLAILAAYGWLYGVAPRLKERYRNVVLGVYLVFTALAPLALIAFNTMRLAAVEKPRPVYSAPSEAAAYLWVRENTAPQALFLTTFDWSGQGSGGRLVAMTGRRAFLGHWIETVAFDDKIALVRRFYDPATSDDWRRRFLADNAIDYIWYSDLERGWGAWQPSQAAFLLPVFETDMVTIYAVP